MALNGKVIYLDPKFGFEYHSTDYNHPVSYRQVWEIETVTMKRFSYCMEVDAIGREATITDGLVSCYLGNGNYFYGKLAQGGQTPSIIIEETPVPRPKVRVDTRWQSGRWEKYLKTKGWVAA
jgi:hypothetical protein